MPPFGRHRHLAALVILAFASPAAARFRVCSFVFNGPEEVDIFRTRLPPEHFAWTLTEEANLAVGSAAGDGGLSIRLSGAWTPGAAFPPRA